MDREEQERLLREAGVPGRPSAPSRVARTLFYLGVVLAVLGPPIGYGLQYGQPPAWQSALGGMLWWLWAACFLGAGVAGLLGWEQAEKADDTGRRYAILAGLAFLALLLVVFLFGVLGAIL